MTAAQKANVARFKAVQAEAKKLKAKNKNLTHVQAVKQAWAIMLHKKPAAKKKATTEYMKVFNPYMPHVDYSKRIKKAAKKAAKKVGAVKKKTAKKPTEKAILKKVHSAKTSSKTLFNKLDKLDEAQHAHMSGINRAAVEKISKINAEIEQRESVIKSVMLRRSELIARNGKDWYPKFMKTAKGYIAELKKHKTELKKFL
jgi:hypothetical protein